jgi:hypothetical protein
MKKQIFSLFLLAAFCLNCFSAAFAQDSPDGWSNLQKIRLGSSLIIEPKAGKSIKASLEKAGSDEIVVYNKKKFLTLKKDSIARIYLSRVGSEMEAKDDGAAIGMVIGFAAGLFVPGGLLIFLGSSGAGMLIGKESAKKKKRGRLIYEAR